MSKPPAAPPPQQQKAPQNPQPDSGEWTDEKLVDALKRLDDLHTKLINLRTVIPRLTLPLSTSHPSPAELYEDLSSRARGASEEVLAFNSLFVKSAHLFDHAAQSRSKDPAGIQAVSVYDVFYPEEEAEEVMEEVVVKKEDEEMKDVEDVAEEEEEEVIEDTGVAEVEEIIEGFRNEGGVEVDVQGGEGGRVVKITLPSPADLLFTVDIPSSSDASDPRRFIVSSVSNTKKPGVTPHLYTSILRAITTRPNPGNLKLLLEMLAEYKSIYEAPCKKCGKMTAGSKVELPVVRRRDTVLVDVEDAAGGAVAAGAKKKGKKKEKIWAPYHEVCV